MWNIKQRNGQPRGGKNCQTNVHHLNVVNCKGSMTSREWYSEADAQAQDWKLTRWGIRSGDHKTSLNKPNIDAACICQS